MYGDANNSLIMAPPLIWVFSNSFPETKKLSFDRWRVFTLGFQKQLIPSAHQCPSVHSK